MKKIRKILFWKKGIVPSQKHHLPIKDVFPFYSWRKSCLNVNYLLVHIMFFCTKLVKQNFSGETHTDISWVSFFPPILFSSFLCAKPNILFSFFFFPERENDPDSKQHRNTRLCQMLHKQWCNAKVFHYTCSSVLQPRSDLLHFVNPILCTHIIFTSFFFMTLLHSHRSA